MAYNTPEPGYITPQDYGAAGNGVIFDDGAITATTRSFSSNSATFTINDQGKQIGIIGAGAAGATLVTTIASYVSPHAVVLSNSAGTSVTGAHYAYGTDDSAALSRFFAANIGGRAQFQNGSTYISITKQTCQLKYLEANNNPLVFLISNNTDDCFTVVPPAPGAVSQITSRAVYSQLYLDAVGTGLDLLQYPDGSMCFYTLTLDNSYRDAMMLNPTVANATYIENLTGSDWIFRNCGRHGMHIYLLGPNSGVGAAFMNETNIFAWEIRGIGVRFGSGTGATAANAIRMTYDNISDVNISKVGHFLINGANWDCAVGSSLAGAAVGDVIYQNAINGTTARRVEGFQIRPGGIESTNLTVAGPPLFITGNAMVAGDWVECDIDQGQVFGWGIGLNTAMLISPTDNNTYTDNSPGRGQVYRSAVARPTPSPFPSATQPTVSLPSYDAAPFGGYIDGAFRNSLVVSQIANNLIASGTQTFTFSFSNPLGSPVAQDFAQWPLLVTISSIPNVGNLAEASYAEYVVLISEQQSGSLTFVMPFIKYNNTSSNYAFTFTPASVTFATGGSGNNSFIVSVPGGASVGTAGASALCNVWMGRPFGIGERSFNTASVASGAVSSISMGI